MGSQAPSGAALTSLVRLTPISIMRILYALTFSACLLGATIAKPSSYSHLLRNLHKRDAQRNYGSSAPAGDYGAAQAPACRTEYKQECNTVNEQECNTVNEQQCRTVQEQQCNTVQEQECNTVNEQQCNTVNEQQCNTV